MHQAIEVEVKYTLSKRMVDRINKYIRSNEYALKAKSQEKDTYYSRPDVDFLATKECLRIRRTSEYAELTYKPGSTQKMHKEGKFWKQELNLNLSDKVAEDTAHSILLNLDYLELVTVEKERKTYTKDKVSLSLDFIVGLGYFLEIEIMASKKGVKEAIRIIDNIADELGLGSQESVKLPYRDLLLEAQSQSKLVQKT